MPEAFSGTDVVIYRATKLLAPYLGAVDPNLISFGSLLMMIPIIHNLYYNGPILNTFILVFIKQFLDCLDGTVAREHNKMSGTGVALDFICDYISGVLYLSFAANLIVTNKNHRKNMILIIITGCLIYWLVDDIPTLQQMIKCNQNNDITAKCLVKNDFNAITRFLHDNSVMSQVIGVMIFKMSIM